MTQDELLLIGTVLMALAWVPALAIVWEINQVPWFKGPYRRIGRVLFSKSAIIAAILTVNLIGALGLLWEWERPLWFEILRTATFGLVVPVLWWQAVVYRTERLNPNAPQERDPDLTH
jgi:hypothetical protein